jgi:uncharacterized protein
MGFFLECMENYIIILLCIASFFAGFVDAIVGGGGLIQTPISLLLLPNIPVANIIGTLKIPGISGTSFAAFQYIKKVKLNWKMLFPMGIVAFLMSFFGSYLLVMVKNDFMKPILIFVLILVAIYTFFKKDFGQSISRTIPENKMLIFGILISLCIGFYDGFIGPGTGSFLVVTLISFLGFDFLNASTNAKLINVATNLGSICFFILKGKIIWAIAIPMAICNAFGGWLGAKIAIKKGNGFIRMFFLIVVVGTLLRLFYDVFLK